MTPSSPYPQQPQQQPQPYIQQPYPQQQQPPQPYGQHPQYPPQPPQSTPAPMPPAYSPTAMPRTGSSFGAVIRWVSAGLLFALLVLYIVIAAIFGILGAAYSYIVYVNFGILPILLIVAPEQTEGDSSMSQGLFVTGGMLIVSLFEIIAHATVGVLGESYTKQTYVIAPNLWNVPSHEAIISLCLYAFFITVYAIAFVVSLVLFLQNSKRGMYR